MPKLNGKGPENMGSKTGRGLGRCRKPEDQTKPGNYGAGVGKRRKSGGGEGRGKRLQSGFIPVMK